PQPQGAGPAGIQGRVPEAVLVPGVGSGLDAQPAGPAGLDPGTGDDLIVPGVVTYGDLLREGGHRHPLYRPQDAVADTVELDLAPLDHAHPCPSLRPKDRPAVVRQPVHPGPSELLG